MFGFLTSVRSGTADPLADLMAVEAFWRGLPRDDAIAAQKAVCAAIADPNPRKAPNSERVRALLAFDRHIQSLLDALLANGSGMNPPCPLLEGQSRQAAFELCRSLGRLHTQFLGSMREGARSSGASEGLPYVVLCLYRHRQMELALRPFVDERSTRFPWPEVHKVHQLAQSRAILHDSLPVNRHHSSSGTETTLEREYIHVLLANLMSSGHFPPRDAVWITRSLPRWSATLALVGRPHRHSETYFLVDPDGDAGLARSSPDSPESCLCFDINSVLESIHEEIASLGDVASRPGSNDEPSPGRRLKVLRKLTDICTPGRSVVARRGERKPLALTVEVACGLTQILRILRGRPEPGSAVAPGIPVTGDGSTVTGFGDLGAATGTYGDGSSTDTQWSVPSAAASRPTMAMVDCSDSGCRLLGPTLAATPIIPGALIAFRENSTNPWSLAVVRRVKKRLAGKRVEIGVEYLGQDPRWVVVVPESDTAAPSGSPEAAPQRFAAIFLPESASHPVLPMKTLILPARGLAPDDRLSIRSRKSIHTVQLKEPLEEQAEFLWSPFEILDRWLKDVPASGKRDPDRGESTA